MRGSDVVTPPPPRCVLVLRFSAAGDIVLTAPAVQALARAWPDSRIVFVTHAHFVKLMQAHPAVHEVVGLRPGDSLWQLRARLAAWSPDAILDLHGKARAGLLRLSFAGARRARFRKRPLSQTLAVRLGGARYHAHMHIAARYHEAVERLVGRALPREPLRHYVDPPDAERARGLLAAAGLRPGQTLVGMSPGAMWRTKRWPPERFGRLAAWALGQGAAVVVTGSPAEASVNRQVLHAAPGSLDLTGQLDLGTLAGVVAACDAFVANDSGPMHIARALQVPTVALFGSTDPGQFDFTGHALLYAGVACSPCSFHGLAACPRGHLACLGDLAVADAQAALAKLLAQGRPASVVG